MDISTVTRHRLLGASATFTLPEGFTEASIFNRGTSDITITNEAGEQLILPAGAAYTWSYRNMARGVQVIATGVGGAASIAYEF